MADVYADNTVIEHQIIIPHVLVDLIGRIYLARILNEKFQYAVFHRRNIDRHTVNGNDLLLIIQSYSSVNEYAVIGNLAAKLRVSS